MLEKGSKGTDHLGRVFVDYGNKRVGLNNTWDNKDLENHWVISSYELRNTTEKPTHFPTSQAITKEKDIHSLNSVGPNPTTNPLKTQDLSPLELAKERTNELLKQIPEVIEKGIKDDDYIGHARYNDDIEVGLSSQKGNTPLKNHYMITSFERDEKILRELDTNGTLSNNYRDGINYSTSNLNEPNLTTNPLKTQDLSPLEQANAEKLAKLESERLESGNKIFDFYSNRNFTDFRDARPQPSTSKDSRPLPTTLDEPNLTQKSLTSQENLLKIRENLFITEI